MYSSSVAVLINKVGRGGHHPALYLKWASLGKQFYWPFKRWLSLYKYQALVANTKVRLGAVKKGRTCPNSHFVADFRLSRPSLITAATLVCVAR